MSEGMLLQLWDAATAFRDLVEKAKSIPGWVIIDGIQKAKPIIEAIEARWGKDVWEGHRNSRKEAPNERHVCSARGAGFRLCGD